MFTPFVTGWAERESSGVFIRTSVFSCYHANTVSIRLSKHEFHRIIIITVLIFSAGAETKVSTFLSSITHFIISEEGPI